jgi:hypothetical protein
VRGLRAERTAARQKPSAPPSFPSVLSPRTSVLAQRRRGSVLLIVVVLLLMLAIMGTSYLLTTRVDRITSSGDVANTQIDQLVDGTRDLAVSYIVNGLFAFNGAANVNSYTYRPANTAGYNHYDIPDYAGTGANDFWLADRVPTVPAPGAAASAGNLPTWAAITAPMNGAGAAPIWTPGGTPVFESPLPAITGGSFGTFMPSLVAPITYAAHANLTPTFVQVPGTTTSYPAFTVSVAKDGAGNSANNSTLVAGDADGDGIADCGLMRIPGSYADGLTYYAGIRIIDNNSAVNVNTAWDDQYDYNLATGINFPPASIYFPSFFPSAVGLSQLMGNTGPVALNSAPSTGAGTDMANLNLYRMLAGSGSSTVTSLQPIDDTLKSHTDVNYYSYSDALYHLLSRRLANPGFMDLAGDHYRAFGDADGAALAYHFGLINTSIYGDINNNVPMTDLEYILINSVYFNAPNYSAPSAANQANGYSRQWRSYPAPMSTSSPNPVAQWYNDNFYPSLSTPPSITPTLRPILVTRNGVSNAAPAVTVTPTAGVLTVANAAMVPYGDRGRWQANIAYGLRDCVTYTANSNVGGASTLPGTIFSGAFFSRVANNIGNPPTGLADEVNNTDTKANWARPSYWLTGTSYITGDYAFLDENNTTVAADQFHFYRALQNNSGQLPTTATNAYWQVWTPPATAMSVKANVNTAAFPELFRAYFNAMTAVTNSPLMTPFGFPQANISGGATPDPTQIYVGNQYAPTPPFRITSSTMNPQFMFRSPVRENRATTDILGSVTGTVFDPYQVLQLRAALAAVNAESMRNPNLGVISREIPLNLSIDGTPTPVNAIVYSNQPQLYITEVYAQTNLATQEGTNGPNVSGYVAIEIYNPSSSTVTFNMANWQPAIVDAVQPSTGRSTGTTETILQLPASNMPPALAPGQFALLENYNGTGAAFAGSQNPNITSTTPAVYRPATSGLPPVGALNLRNVTDVYVPQLAAVLQAYAVVSSGTAPTAERNEFMLFKPRGAAFPGAATSGTDGAYTWTETNINDMVPDDAFDFTGINAGTPSGGSSPPVAEDWHYVRSAFGWKYVYPGRYNGAPPTPFQGGHQQGTVSSGEWFPQSTGDPGFTGTGATPAVAFGTAQPNSTYLASEMVLQLTNNLWAGPNKPSAAGPNTFPFGGFARNGDIVEAPFIGSYQIRNPANGAIIETNPVTMDTCFAEDSDTYDDNILNGNAVEAIGRFCPGPRDMISYSSAVNGGNVTVGNRTLTDPNIPNPAPTTGLPPNSYFTGNSNPRWFGWDVVITAGAGAGQAFHIVSYTTGSLNLDVPVTGSLSGPCTYMICRPYWWTTHLLDYLTVQDPRNDYIPNADPSAYPAATAVPPYPMPVSNSNTAVAANTDAENTESVQGLVNINTASLAVLESLPLVVNGTTGLIDPINNPLVAQAIINDRTKYGPFKTIFDLNRIYDVTDNTNSQPLLRRGFMNGWGTIPYAGTSTAALGDLIGGTAGAMANQFDEYTLQVDRLSNLITTRSDTFTVYIVVQGWQNAGTNSATLVNTRRAAFIVDRNTVTPVSRSVRTVTVPNN